MSLNSKVWWVIWHEQKWPVYLLHYNLKLVNVTLNCLIEYLMELEYREFLHLLILV